MAAPGALHGRAGVVRGTFDGVRQVEEVGPWGSRFTTRHSRIVLDAFLSAAFTFVTIAALSPEDAEAAVTTSRVLVLCTRRSSPDSAPCSMLTPRHVPAASDYGAAAG